jgi:hypothetical protein
MEHSLAMNSDDHDMNEGGGIDHHPTDPYLEDILKSVIIGISRGRLMKTEP